MQHMPLEVFVFVGTFLEEIVSPIPSFVVMVPAGAAAQLQGHTVWYLLLLAVCASVGRMIGGSLLYFAADKLEDVIFAKDRRFFGVSHKDVEGFGKKISSKKAHQAWLFLFVISAIPFLPTSALSAACGFVKVRYATFLTSNFLGSIINSLFFLGIGYAGIKSISLFKNFEFAGQALITVAVLALVGWFVVKKIRARRKPPSK